jgi:hypothetical protein
MNIIGISKNNHIDRLNKKDLTRFIKPEKYQAIKPWRTADIKAELIEHIKRLLKYKSIEKKL